MRGRILFVTSSFPRWHGDAVTPFVLHLAQDLQSLGWDITALAPHAPGATRAERLDGIRVERFRYLWPDNMQTVCYNGGALANLRRQPLNFLKLPLFVASEWIATRRRLVRHDFDLVHSHWLLPQGYVCSRATRSLGIPHVATIHGGDVLALRNALLDRFRRVALAGATCVTVNSSVTRSAVEGLVPAGIRIERIPMGATDARADPGRVAQLRAEHRPPQGCLLLFVGRLVEEKGVGDAIAALPTILRCHPGARLLVVGDGPDRARLEARSRALGVAAQVTFAGWVDSARLPDYYTAADLFVGPSRRAANGWIEAQGLTFAEAMLSALPVIATASGGIVDQVRDGETGLLVSEGSSDGIAAAVLRLRANPELARRLAVAGQLRARQELTREASARAFSRTFDGLLGRESA